MTDFDKIPQEKFDTFQNAFDESSKKFPLEQKDKLPAGGLKVKSIDIQNIKNISYINESFSDWVVIGGHNANGKSSFIDSIFGAISGHTFYNTSIGRIIKQGENEATISLQLQGEEKEIILKRDFKISSKNPTGKSTLEIYIDGKESKITQKELNEIINVLTIDPLGLDKMNVPDSIKEIQKISGLDLSEINRLIKDYEEQRKEANIYVKTCQGAVDSYGFTNRIEAIDVTSLVGLLQEFQKIESLKQSLQEKLTTFQSNKLRIESLKKQLEEIEKEQEEIKTSLNNLKLEIAEKEKQLEGKPNREEINTQIQNAEEINKKANLYEMYEKDVEKRNLAKKEWEVLNEKVEELRQNKTKMIQNSKMPEYMSIDEELGILVDGIEYKQLNTAKKIEVAIDMVLLSGSPLRVLRIQEGGELDLNTLSIIQDKVLNAGFQIFIERAKLDEFDTIIIENGEIVNNKDEKIQEEKEKEKTLSDKLNKNGGII